MSKFNRPINRDYFKLKENPKALKGSRYMKCCGSEKDHDVLNVKREYDWGLIEEYIERHLFNYPSTLSVTPVSCKKCGRLLEYKSTIDVDQTLGYKKKDKK